MYVKTVFHRFVTSRERLFSPLVISWRMRKIIFVFSSYRPRHEITKRHETSHHINHSIPVVQCTRTIVAQHAHDNLCVSKQDFHELLGFSETNSGKTTTTNVITRGNLTFSKFIIFLLFQLFIAGILGIYHCANDYENYIGSTKNFIIKVRHRAENCERSTVKRTWENVLDGPWQIKNTKISNSYQLLINVCVHSFWQLSCSNWIYTLPYAQNWRTYFRLI